MKQQDLTCDGEFVSVSKLSHFRVESEFTVIYKYSISLYNTLKVVKIIEFLLLLFSGVDAAIVVSIAAVDCMNVYFANFIPTPIA